MTIYPVELTEGEAAAVVESHPAGATWWTAEHWAYQALADAIRANPPKPPRMGEPGWGGSVWASTTTPGSLRGQRRFVRFSTARCAGRAPWIDAVGACFDWADLIDPEPWRADS